MKNKTAVFFGKFQPPHLGHIITINRILNKFNKLIIAITFVNNSNLNPYKIKKTFEEAFPNNKKINYKIIAGSIEEGTASLKNLKFDIAISGNKKIINILKKIGYKTMFQSRSTGTGFSSSEIRSLHKDFVEKKISKRNTKFNLKFEKLSKIKPLERVMPMHLANIERMILQDGLILKPLIIDKKYKIVLDGSHRYAFLLKFGFINAPVIEVDYEDETIFVGNDLKHRYLIDKNLILNKSKVIKAALNEKLLKPRTTRHFFPFRKINFPVKLNRLIKGKPNNIDFLLEKMTVKKEIEKNISYTNEINEELKILDNYIGEQKDIRLYLSHQIKMMKKKTEY